MLKVVKGNVFEFTITLDNISLSLISKVTFESKSLGIKQNAESEETKYRVRILGEKTKDFPLGFAKYNITLTFLDNETLTVKRGKIEVLNKLGEIKSG